MSELISEVDLDKIIVWHTKNYPKLLFIGFTIYWMRKIFLYVRWYLLNELAMEKAFKTKEARDRHFDFANLE